MKVTKIFPDYDLLELEDCIEINTIIRKKGECGLYHLGQIRMQDSIKTEEDKLKLIKHFIYECYRYILFYDVDRQYAVKDDDYPQITNEYKFHCPIDNNQQTERERLNAI